MAMTNEPDHIPAPSDHAPRKYAARDPDSGTYTVAEEENPGAWVRVDVEESGHGAICEVRE